MEQLKLIWAKNKQSLANSKFWLKSINKKNISTENQQKTSWIENEQNSSKVENLPYWEKN